ncbi:MAG: YdcF family protein [Verrucomicrobiales bacterium]|nr:YdcF family protein [Verrucomicrobiales bacterium]
MSRKRKHSSLYWLLFWPALAVVVVVAGCNLWVVLSTQGRIYRTVDSIEARPAALVLGTTRKIGPDQANPHFDNRLAAAAALYHAGKVSHLLVSGHREASGYYDEPRDMTARLVELGVPAGAITADGAGIRTLDSVVRAKRVYGLERITVISDDFHVSRALFIADREGIDGVAFHGEAVDLPHSVRARTREYLARVKAVMDLYLLHAEPILLGERHTIVVGDS